MSLSLSSLPQLNINLAIPVLYYIAFLDPFQCERRLWNKRFSDDHHSFDAQEDQEAFLAMITRDANAEVVVDGEASIWRDLEHFAATGEFPEHPIQEGYNDQQSVHTGTSASAHVVDDHDASRSQSSSGIPNQIEVSDDSTDSLFGDSPVAASLEPTDDAPLPEYPASAEPDSNNFGVTIDAFLTMLQSHQMSNGPSLNMEEGHRPNGPVHMGGEQVLNKPQAIPELRFSPTNTPPEPFPITPPGAITRTGFANDSILQGYQPFTANARRGEKRKRLEEEFMPTSNHNHGNGDLYGMGSSIMHGYVDSLQIHSGARLRIILDRTMQLLSLCLLTSFQALLEALTPALASFTLLDWLQLSLSQTSELLTSLRLKYPLSLITIRPQFSKHRR